MTFSRALPSAPGIVTLTLITRRQDDGSTGPLVGSIAFTLVDASGQTVHEGQVDISELTSAQRTSLVSLMTTIRSRIQTEAIG